MKMRKKPSCPPPRTPLPKRRGRRGRERGRAIAIGNMMTIDRGAQRGGTKGTKALCAVTEVRCAACGRDRGHGTVTAAPAVDQDLEIVTADGVPPALAPVTTIMGGSAGAHAQGHVPTLALGPVTAAIAAVPKKLTKKTRNTPNATNPGRGLARIRVIGQSLVIENVARPVTRLEIEGGRPLTRRRARAMSNKALKRTRTLRRARVTSNKPLKRPRKRK